MVFEIPHLLAYVLVVLALFLVPGPAVLLILAQSISGGRQVGLATGLGIAVGDGLHTIMAALGLSALLMTSPAAYNLKYAGVAYLVYLGLHAWVAPSASVTQLKAQPIDPRRAFYRALLTEVLNPRTALFFLAFLPQFVRPGGGPVVMQPPHRRSQRGPWRSPHPASPGGGGGKLDQTATSAIMEPCSSVSLGKARRSDP